MNRKLTIYLTNGETLRFEQVSDIDTKFGDTLGFDYVSASRKDVAVRAIFAFANIAGFSVDKE